MGVIFASVWKVELQSKLAEQYRACAALENLGVTILVSRKQ